MILSSDYTPDRQAIVDVLRGTVTTVTFEGPFDDAIILRYADGRVIVLRPLGFETDGIGVLVR